MPVIITKTTLVQRVKSESMEVKTPCVAGCKYDYIKGHKFCPFCGEAIVVIVEVITAPQVEEIQTDDKLLVTKPWTNK